MLSLATTLDELVAASPSRELQWLRRCRNDLRQLGLFTVSDLITAGSAEVGVAFEPYGFTAAEVGATLACLRELLPPEAGAFESLVSMGLGLADLGPPGVNHALAFPLCEGLTFPERCSLLSGFQAIGNQESRGTCVAWAMSALHEYCRRHLQEQLSPQFLYFACKELDQNERSGTYLSTAAQVLTESGQCLEATWPYRGSPASTQGQGPPPAGARAEAMERRLSGAAVLPGASIQLMKQALLGFTLDGVVFPPRPVLIGLPLFPTFFSGAVATTGRVVCPFKGERSRGAHAMVLGGFQDGPEPGGGVFIVRNSWGTGWAHGCVEGPGYCRIPYRYFTDQARDWDFFVLLDQEEVAVLQQPAPSWWRGARAAARRVSLKARSLRLGGEQGTLAAGVASTPAETLLVAVARTLAAAVLGLGLLVGLLVLWVLAHGRPGLGLAGQALLAITGLSAGVLVASGWRWCRHLISTTL